MFAQMKMKMAASTMNDTALQNERLTNLKRLVIIPTAKDVADIANPIAAT